MWKTIDDVNATLDSLSLINRGQPTTSGVNKKITSNKLNYESMCGSETSTNALIKHEQEKHPITPNTLRRGTFPARLVRMPAPAEPDAALKAELNEMFPAGFSNEVIKKRWNPLEKVESYQFEDELFDHENSIGKQFIKKEIEAWRCSTPLTAEFTTDMKSFSHDSPTSSQQESGIVVIQPNSDNSLNNLEYTISNDSEQRQSLSLTHIVTEENVAAQLPVLRPKKCRNALLNSLYKRMAIFGKDMKEIKQPVVSKTPSDFLVPPTKWFQPKKTSSRMQKQ